MPGRDPSNISRPSTGYFHFQKRQTSLKTEILISCDDWENRVAVLEEGALAEIYFEREEKVIGSIYKGRVENVLPGMGACFVNIGLGRNAFLYVDDIMRDPINIGETEITDRRRGNTVSDLLRVGDDVLVQVVKEPRGLKGARVSTNISLPGRYLVLMPTGRYSGVSSRIEDPDERARLKQVMRRVRPEGMATIVRTAAANVSEAELIADLGVQLRLWHGILESYKRASAPALLHKDLNLVFKAVRDFMTSDVEQVVIDSKEQFDEIRSTMSLLGPQYLSRLKLWEGPGNLFAVRRIDDELQKLLKPKIMLPSGGHLVLESTEALTVIDVNTGKFTGGRNLEDTLVRTNIEAAAEIARQVRLRDIGGIIVVDFIDMAHARNRQQVIDTLTGALRRDRTRSTIQVFSNLGLLEFTRKRVGKDLSGQLRSDCPYCGGLGDVMSSETIAIGLLRQIRQRGLDGGRGRKFDVVADPSVATQLMGWYKDEFEKVAKSFSLELHLFVEAHRHRENITFESAKRHRHPLTAGKEVEADLLNVRVPDPASGVAVVEGCLVEVKDGANGTGQTVKLRILEVGPNMTRAMLAEPLAAGKRRRRGRGRGKAEAEESTAPAPPPVERPVAPVVAYNVEEDVDDQYVRRARPMAPAVPARNARRGRSDGRGPERERFGRGRPARQTDTPQPLVVGGEGDIDYDDDEDSGVVAPQKSKAVREEAESARDVGRPRRRRRGRGQKPATEAAEAETQSDEDGEREVRRPPRPHHIIGPIRQLYGPPVSIEQDEPEREARPARPSLGRPVSAGRGRQTRPEPDAETDDLDVVVTPTRPASMKVERVSVEKVQLRQPPRQVERKDGRERERPAQRFERPERPDRPEGERDKERTGGRDRGRDRGRGRPERAPKPPRVGPAIRVLYAPPAADETANDSPTDEPVKPQASRGRFPRGPMLQKDPNAPPLPKGKTRQLWPPADDAAGDEFAESHQSTASGASSLFVNNERELEERRRRARERAETRREPEGLTGWDPPSSPAEPTVPESPLESSSFWAPVDVDPDDGTEG